MCDETVVFEESPRLLYRANGDEVRSESKRKKFSKVVERAPSSRPTVAEIRNQRIEKEYALLLQFSSTRPVKDANLRAWRAIEKYGFTVLYDRGPGPHGCLIPHVKAYPKDQEDSLKLNVGYVCAMVTFMGVQVSKLGQAGKDSASSSLAKHRGWPEDLQISHLCHIPMCCNPAHMVVEQRYMKMRRKFCGDENNTCDCPPSFSPRCIAPYFSDTQSREVVVFHPHNSNKAARISAMLPDHLTVKIIDPTQLRVPDEKRKNQRIRRNREKKHARQALRNTIRRNRFNSPFARSNLLQIE
mmetsp:Transcript_8659/g.15656  ORF Transcript_8659/g.15656 Transcript_8659/m.15656 type:complete len:299 (-) Transcript_8659:7-903(-)